MKKRNNDERSRSIMYSNAISSELYRKKVKDKRKRTRSRILVFLSVVVILIAAAFAVNLMRIGIIDEVILEAGDDMVKASAFFENGNENAEFFGSYSVDTGIPGEYELRVRNGVMLYNVKLTVRDTVPPRADKKHISMTLGDSDVPASSFVRNIDDKSRVIVSYKAPVDFSALGDTDVTVVLTDMGGNKKEYTCLLTVFPKELMSSCTLEAGSKKVSISDFLREGYKAGVEDTVLTELSQQELSTISSKNVVLNYNGIDYTATLKIRDTVPPRGYVINQTTYKGKTVSADKFIKKLYDETNVTVTYRQEPDFNEIGAKVTEICLEDEGGNKTYYKVTLTVKEDKTPPVIYAEDRTVYIGDNIRFTEGVRAEDKNDGLCKVTAEPGDFDPNKEGVYTVRFTAVDSSGNKASEKVHFTVEKKSSEKVKQSTVDRAFSELFGQIIFEEMTEREKMRAIYDYIRENIAYNGTSDKSDPEQEAYRGIRDKAGDSFTFCSVSQKLLTMAGIENTVAERVNSTSSHYWNIVYYEGGKYHFDTCPHYKGYPIDSFLITDEQAKAYSEKTNGYYDYRIKGETKAAEEG